LPSSAVVFALSFFFQAEDGIRAFHVTGVQTCALPILPPAASGASPPPGGCSAARTAARLTPDDGRAHDHGDLIVVQQVLGFKARSEERRVGKGCRSRRVPSPQTRKRESIARSAAERRR